MPLVHAPPVEEVAAARGDVTFIDADGDVSVLREAHNKLQWCSGMDGERVELTEVRSLTLHGDKLTAEGLVNLLKFGPLDDDEEELDEADLTVQLSATISSPAGLERECTLTIR